MRAALAVLAADLDSDRARSRRSISAARCQAAGRQVLAASRAMTRAIDYQHVSILWAGPSTPPSRPTCTRGLFDEPGTRRHSSGFSAHPGCHRVRGAARARRRRRVGFIVGQLAADEAEILTLGVRKDRQRHGIGRRLVEALARAAKKAEARRLFLEVAPATRRRWPLQVAGLPGDRAAQGLLSSAAGAGRGCADAGALTFEAEPRCRVAVMRAAHL